MPAGSFDSTGFHHPTIPFGSVGSRRRRRRSSYWGGGGGLRLEDNFLVTAGGAERLSSFPDDFRVT